MATGARSLARTGGSGPGRIHVCGHGSSAVIIRLVRERRVIGSLYTVTYFLLSNGYQHARLTMCCPDSRESQDAGRRPSFPKPRSARSRAGHDDQGLDGARYTKASRA